jgi:3-dehydroquinate dehydratase-1
LEVARAYAAVPTLVTIRSAAEGGAWSGDERARAALFGAVVDLVDGVDVELSSTAILPGVIAAAHAAGRVVVVSHHDFDATPPVETLAEVAERAKAAGADYVKVAMMARDQRDVRTLADFTLRYAGLGLIAVAMGPYGAASRVFFPSLGSRLTFAHLGRASAPGQLPVAELLPLLRRFCPDDRQRVDEPRAGQVVTAFFDAWRAGDGAGLRALLADDVALQGPLGVAGDADQCVRLLLGMADISDDISVLRQVTDGSEVLSWFELTTTLARKPSVAASWCTVFEGRIARLRIAFDPRPIAS